MRLSRALFGYSPAAARAAQAHIEEQYRQIADQLSAQLGAPEAGPASVFGLERMTLHVPRHHRLPMVLFGYQVQAVKVSFAQLHRLWEADLDRLAADVTRSREKVVREASMLAVAEVAVAEVAVAEVAVALEVPSPVVPPAPLVAAPRPAARVVPMRRLGGGPRPPVVWRPGAIEEYEGLHEPVPAAQPRQSESVRLAVSRAPALVPQATVLQAMAPEPAPGVEIQVQQGLAGRLEILFQRFLVGKAVGADLVLPTGQVLVARGVLVTRELVAQAEEAGLLPSLIANMTIPGLSAE